MQSFHRLVHILHQERIMKAGKVRTEEVAGLGEGTHATLNQKFRKHGVYSQFRRKLTYDLRVTAFPIFPFLFSCHSIQRYRFFCNFADQANINNKKI